MRVGLVGDFTARRDEGLKNLALDLRDRLARRHDVVTFDLTRVGASREWRTFREARPEVVHYLPGNTTRSLAVAGLLARHARAPHILSCPHPRYSWVYRHLPALTIAAARAFPPRRAIVQSAATKLLFERAGVPARLIPNGVDTSRFTPAAPDEKARLREEVGLPLDARVVLHVGHLRRVRNLHVLARVAEAGMHAVLVASQYLPEDPGVRRGLEAAGVDVRVGYDPRVERYYRASDAYLFPCPLDHTLLTPLSVLEALACGVPVATRPFEGLLQIFPGPSRGIAFVEQDDEFVPAIDALLRAPPGAARSLAEHASLDAVVTRIEGLYEEVVT